MAYPVKLTQISSLVGQPIFFDANVLIYIFWPTGNHHWEANYSKAFHNLLKQKNPLALDSTIVSEVVNRVVRFEYEKYKNGLNPGVKAIPFKKFRNEADGQQALRDLFVIFQNDILPKFEVIGKAFTKLEIETFMVADTLDFSDKVIAQICTEHNLILFTDDIDFKATGLTVLSGNPGY